MELKQEQPKGILPVLFLGVLMGALDIAIIGPALPAIHREFSVDARQLSWVLNSYMLFFLTGSLVMAKLSDRIGRRTVYIADIAIFAIGSLVVGFAQNFEMLIIGRAIQGIGGGGIFPVASAEIADTVPADKRGKALGMIGAVFGIAFIIGPILGGLLLLIGWRWLFFVNIPVAIAVIAMAAKQLPKDHEHDGARFDGVGTILVFIMLASLTWGISQFDLSNPLASFCSTSVWPWLLGALLSLILIVFVEQRVEDPILAPKLFKSTAIRRTLTLAAITGVAESSLAYLVTLGVVNFGFKPSTASFMILPMIFAMALSSPLSGRLLDKTGTKPILIGGSVLTFIGILGLGLFSTSLPAYVILLVILGLGISGLLGAPLRYVILSESPRELLGSAQGSLSLIMGIGQLVGGAMIGAVAQSHSGTMAQGFRTSYLVVAVVVSLAVGISILMENCRAVKR